MTKRREMPPQVSPRTEELGGQRLDIASTATETVPQDLLKAGRVLLAPIADRFSTELGLRRTRAKLDKEIKEANEFKTELNEESDRRFDAEHPGLKAASPAPNHRLHTPLSLQQGAFSLRFLTRPKFEPDGTVSHVERIRAANKYAHSLTPQERKEFRVHRGGLKAIFAQIRQILDVPKNSDIYAALDPKVRKKKTAHANSWVAKTFRVPINKGQTAADEVQAIIGMESDYIDGLRFGLFEPSEIVGTLDRNEKLKGEKSTTDLVELLSIAFNENNSLQQRHEAARALEHARPFAAIRQRERNLLQQRRNAVKEAVYQRYTSFLDDNVWKKDPVSGSPITSPLTILSGFSTDDYSCLGTQVVRKEDIPAIKAALAAQNPETTGIHYRLKTVNTRTFTHNGINHTAYIDKDRPEKDKARQAQKMMEKREEDPNAVIKDDIGVIIVVRSRASAYAFVDAVNEAARKNGNSFGITHWEDTLAGGEYSAEGTGSSSTLRMLKFIGNFDGNGIEHVVNTDETSNDYNYSDKNGHYYFELKRYLDRPYPNDPTVLSVFEQDFPPDIYKVDPQTPKEDLVAKRRAATRLGIV
ncbi:MAG: hypothetical protein HY426_00530 [Candidatus Levybacteria bacterium]|nr:hypothetical protein [Candidatus Levybacteria bacterium]